MTEPIWLALIGVLCFVIAGLAGIGYASIIGRIVALERRSRRTVSAMLKLNTVVHPDANKTIEILRPLIDNGDAEEIR